MRKEAALILLEYSKHMSEQGTGAKFRMKKKPASSSSAKGFPPLPCLFLEGGNLIHADLEFKKSFG